MDIERFVLSFLKKAKYVLLDQKESLAFLKALLIDGKSKICNNIYGK